MNEKIAALICLLFGIMIMTVILNTSGCGTTTSLPEPKPTPTLHLKFWQGDSKEAGIVRAQDDKVLKCSDPEFNEYVCLSHENLIELNDAINSCKSW
jgi:uncharacterized protein YceK